MEKQPLDEYCKNIVSVMLLIREEIRFNELYRLLNEHGFDVSKPTLSEHLKHLTKKKIAIRKRGGKQKITYRINFERFNILDKSSDALNALLELHLREEKWYKALPINEQVQYVHGLMMLQDLFLLKTELLYASEPDRKLEHFLNLLFAVRYFNIFRDWLLTSCQENPQLREEAMKAISKIAQKYSETPPLRSILQA